MRVEEAIKKAIEGGWQSSRSLVCSACHSSDYFLDPSFWRNLGKSLGWGKIKVSWFIESSAKKWGLTNKLIEVTGERDEWNYQFHRFIDHVAAGKDAKSFFQDL